VLREPIRIVNYVKSSHQSDPRGFMCPLHEIHKRRGGHVPPTVSPLVSSFKQLTEFLRNWDEVVVLNIVERISVSVAPHTYLVTLKTTQKFQPLITHSNCRIKHSLLYK